MTLTKANCRTAYLSNLFHLDISSWKTLCARMKTRPTNFAEIVQQLLTDLGYTDTSGIGGGGVWLNSNYDGSNLAWRLEWPTYIQDNLISFDNPIWEITNSDLKLVALVIQETIFMEVCKKPAWRTPITSSNNTPTVVWIFKEATTINPVVANLLCICSIVNTNTALNPIVFYHIGPLNTVVNDASR